MSAGKASHRRFARAGGFHCAPNNNWLKKLFFKSLLSPLSGVLLGLTPLAAADRLLVEAESFQRHGGWSLDTQFIEIMGSPYLLAHGLGKPVGDATTTVNFPAAGTYRVWVRTKDWV